MERQYATVDDYETYFGALSGEAERSRVEALIPKASERLYELVSRYDVNEAERASALEEVCCNMVNRKMRVTSAWPVRSLTQQAGSFSETVGYAVSTRSGWQLYAEDYEALGISRGGMEVVWPYGGDCHAR